MADGYGHVAWWGFSPALDLQGVAAGISQKSRDELNILIIGAGDPRHIFKTMAWAHRHGKAHLRFYIIDNCVEVYARHMILLSLIMEPLTECGLQEKTELYLEIFGNTLIRGITDTYISSKANDFIRMVTDYSYLQQKLPCLNLEALKYKEVDHLEAVFKFWRNPDTDVFDIAKCWDLRLRQHLGVRYDAREGFFDWDYHMTLREKNAATINIVEYKKWRRTGIAFEIRDGEYTFPNKTLSSILNIKHLGENHFRRGYWGEILTSPYIAFGIECEDKELLKKVNETYRNSAQDISYHNIISLFHEFTYGEKYQFSNSDSSKTQEKNNEESAISKMQEITENDSCENISNCATHDDSSTISDKKQSQNNDNLAEEENRSSIIFLPIKSLDALYNKSKYRHFFDIMYFSNSSTCYFLPEVQELLSDDAIVIIETITYILNMDTEFPKTLLEKMKEIATNAKCKLIEPVDVAKDAHITFLHKKI